MHLEITAMQRVMKMIDYNELNFLVKFPGCLFPRCLLKIILQQRDKNV